MTLATPAQARDAAAIECIVEIDSNAVGSVYAFHGAGTDLLIGAENGVFRLENENGLPVRVSGQGRRMKDFGPTCRSCRPVSPLSAS
jgi:hypothetical protein